MECWRGLRPPFGLHALPALTPSSRPSRSCSSMPQRPVPLGATSFSTSTMCAHWRRTTLPGVSHLERPDSVSTWTARCCRDHWSPRGAAHAFASRGLHREDHMPLRRCSDRAPTSSRPSMAKSSPMRGMLTRYVASTPSSFQVVNVLEKNHVSKIKILHLIGFVIFPSILSDTEPQWRPGSGLTWGLVRVFTFLEMTFCIRPLLTLSAQSKRLWKTDAE
jgi:hypothetical protein